jgi:lycopene beta-cyclase
MISMHEQGMFNQKRVLIIEKELKNLRDKTFCFWSQENDAIESTLHDIISTTWHSAILPGNIASALDPFRYNHVSSLDLYRRVDQLVEFYGWQRIQGEVLSIKQEEHTSLVVTHNCAFSGQLIFDSRTPEYMPVSSGETHLYQSFIGWHIKPLKGLVNSDGFRFMDFDIDQSEFTQFVYTLPYPDGTLLVEVTRFGNEKIQSTDAEQIIHDYILRKLGDYTKLDEEQGCIPMSNAKLDLVYEKNVVQLGARNYAIKSSTGYAFKKMFLHAQSIANSIAQGESPAVHNRTHSHVQSGRFAFYDRLLLDILHRKPQEGKRIFISLFKRTSVPTVMKFLDEKTTLLEELLIFAGLPILPFLRSLWSHVTSSVSFRPLIITILTLILLVLPWQSEITTSVSSLALIGGLFLVGIPHGAVDHLIETKQWNLKRMPFFIIEYLSLGALMYLFWILSPTSGLVLFILYSAWHFGQADGALWRLNDLQSFAWGMSLLTFILSSHMDETNKILQAMGTIPISFSMPWWSFLPWAGWFVFKRNAAAAITVCWIMLCSQLPLLISFGLYFIGQHSITGWKHIQKHLQMSSKQIWLHSLPFHAGAWILLLLFFLLQPAEKSGSSSTWGLFFTFLACLSLPHVLAMQKVYKKI